MRKFRFLALIIATIVIIGCFASCNKTDDNGEDGSGEAGPSITVEIMVYSGVDMANNTAYETPQPVIGAPTLAVPTTEGSITTANTVLNTLINTRKAGGNNVSVTFTSSGGVDSITFDSDVYTSGRLLSERTGTEKIGDSDDTYAVKYYDVFVWEWACNGEVIKSVADTEIKNGDKLTLTLVYDNTSVEGYEPVETGE